VSRVWWQVDVDGGDEDTSWTLACLRHHIGHARLAFFGSYFLPTAQWLDETAVSIEGHTNAHAPISSRLIPPRPILPRPILQVRMEGDERVIEARNLRNKLEQARAATHGPCPHPPNTHHTTPCHPATHAAHSHPPPLSIVGRCGPSFPASRRVRPTWAPRCQRWRVSSASPSPNAPRSDRTSSRPSHSSYVARSRSLRLWVLLSLGGPLTGWPSHWLLAAGWPAAHLEIRWTAPSPAHRCSHPEI
jgi:hypothetical protein